MRTIIAILFIVFGVTQGTPPKTGVIEGTVVRTSKSEPISGVQIVLVPPVATTASAQPGTAPAPQATGPLPTPPAQGLVSFQVIAGADGTRIQTSNGLSVTVPPTASTAEIQSILATINARGTPGSQITEVTDSDGRFAFRNLAPGQYTIRAQRDGYFGAATPQGTYSGMVMKSVTVEADKTTKVELGMVQGGVLRGLVRDPDGQPVPNYTVATARPGYTNAGRYIWNLNGIRSTDDRGEYRWPGFPPGEYYVGVSSRAPGPIANVQDLWARVFYPGVIDPNQARPVTIPEGGEVTVDLATQVKPWSVVKISGLALNPLPNLAPDPVTGVVNRAVTALVLMPLDLTPLDNPPTTIWTQFVATSTKPNGEFVLSNVDPGRYELYAMAVDQQNRRVWTGHLPVEVRDKDITGLNIPISPGVTLQGEVVITGGGNLRPEAARIQLQALDTLPYQVAQVIGSVSVDPSGKFQIANLSEGRYRMAISGLPAGAYVSNILQGSTSVFDDGFDMDARASQVPIRVEINTAGETVEGDVRISQLKDAPNAFVALVPTATRRNNPQLYKTAVADDKGHFVIRGVPPGPYTIFAWSSVLPGAYQNAEFLKKYESRGRTLNIQAGNRSEIQLELIQEN